MPGRKLNVPRIKRVVMFLSGAVLGALGGLTGISAQSAASPYLTFMLGYATPKAAASSFVFAMWSAAAGVAAWAWASGATPDLGLCAGTALGGVIGAAVAARVAASPRGLPVRMGRATVTLGLVVVLVEAVRPRFGGPATLWAEWLRGPTGSIAVGAACGAVARGLSLPMGVFLVPAFVHVAGLSPDVALVSSLSVAILAGALPMIGCLTRSEPDEGIRVVLSAGGIVGGAAGGFLLSRCAGAGQVWPLALFAVTAMLLCSWLAYRAAD